MDIFFARQGVYNKNKKVEAFELKFYNSNTVSNEDSDNAKLQLLCSCGTIGISHFTSSKKAFVQFNEIAILEDIPSLLGREVIIVDISEDFILNSETLEALKELKEDGYTISMYNISNIDKIKEFKNFIDIYKIDFSVLSKEKRIYLKNHISSINSKAMFMAINVDNEMQYNDAVKEGYTYFQGSFFGKSERVMDKDITARNVNRFNIILELLKDNFDIDKIEFIIKSDVGISYKLMRFLNSAAFSFVQKISSIRQAIMLLGREELRKWLTLIVISEMQIDSNEELSNNTIIRGRLCELICDKISKEKKSHAFIVGLFSNLNEFINMDMESIVSELPIDNDIKDALLGKENALGNILSLVKAYEVMDSEKMDFLTDKLSLNKKELLQMYLDSIDWLNELTISLK